MALTARNPVHEASGPPQATRTLESPTHDARSGFTINHQHPYPSGVLPKTSRDRPNRLQARELDRMSAGSLILRARPANPDMAGG
jgi:hypothetical protein